MKKGRVTAARLPTERKPRARGKMPDFAARQRKLFGDKIIPDRVMKLIMDECREKY
jgi:hypothetical protein